VLSEQSRSRVCSGHLQKALKQSLGQRLWQGRTGREAVHRGASAQLQQSNSGEWDGLVNEITSVVEDTEYVIEELEVEEKSWEEWDEVAAGVALAPVGFSYDSSYDSSCSSTGSGAVAEEMRQALASFSQDKNHRPTELPTAPVSAAAPASTEVPVVNQKVAGMEFSAGVHLIEEMENQVKQWEESESRREEAYKAWVTQQMVRTAAIHSAEHSGCEAPVGVF